MLKTVCYNIRMRAVVQRVSRCTVNVGSNVVGEIGAGVLVLLGVSKTDNEAAADYLVEKIMGLRIFEDAEGKMNRSVLDSGGAVLVVSQFTLYGDVRRGRRPSFDDAARPVTQEPLTSTPSSNAVCPSPRFLVFQPKTEV